MKAISDELVSELEKQREDTEREALRELTAMLDSFEEAASTYYEFMIRSISDVCDKMTNVLHTLESEESLMNRAYAMRIVDWIKENNNGKLTQENIDSSVSGTSRIYGESLSIETMGKIILHRDLLLTQNLLQENLYLSSVGNSNGKEFTR